MATFDYYDTVGGCPRLRRRPRMYADRRPPVCCHDILNLFRLECGVRPATRVLKSFRCPAHLRLRWLDVSVRAMRAWKRMDRPSKRLVTTLSLYELVCPLPKDLYQAPDILWQDFEEELSQLGAPSSGQRCDAAAHLLASWTSAALSPYGELGLLLHTESALKTLPLLGGHVRRISDPVSTEIHNGTPKLRRSCQHQQEHERYQRQSYRIGAALVMSRPNRHIVHDSPNPLSSPANCRLRAWVPRLVGDCTPDAPLSSSHHRGLEEGTQNEP